MKTENEIEGYILAGGASSRMGRDKARLFLGEETFIERAAQALSAISGNNISVVGGIFDENPQARLSEEFFELQVLPDFLASEKRAAIFGLHSALKHAESEWIAALACDLPFASGALLKRLAEFRVENSRRFAAVAPLQPDGRIQPLCALYRREECLAQIEEMILTNDWSLKKLLERVETREAKFAEISDLPDAEKFFLNVNTPEDYEKALKLLET